MSLSVYGEIPEKCMRCPFCGSSDTALTPSLNSADYVECRYCWAHGPIINEHLKDKKKNRENAIKAWNERV